MRASNIILLPRSCPQERIQKDLHQYGLFIYNANISEMRDKDEQNR